MVQDYNPQSSPDFFNFDVGTARRMCTNFPIIVDQTFEELEEDFFADLLIFQTERVIIDPPRTRIVIQDVDGETIISLQCNVI